jgi:hypothetical protein
MIKSSKKYICSVYVFSGEQPLTEAQEHWVETRKTLKHPSDAGHPQLINAKTARYEVRTELTSTNTQ